LIKSVETLVQPPETPPEKQQPKRNTANVQRALKKGVDDLRRLIVEKDAQIEQLTQENKFLHEELERMHHRLEEEYKRSDKMISQMQVAGEKSSKQANAIIMHLSQQVEKQAEQIAVLQESQGFKGAIRQLKSRLALPSFDSIKRVLQP